jgi:hypothetical protein
LTPIITQTSEKRGYCVRLFAEKTTQLITIHSDVPGKPNNPANKKSQKVITRATFTEGLDQRQPIPEMLVARAGSSAGPGKGVPELSVGVPIVLAKPLTICDVSIKK